jgi:ketosteroid isomerase-like protein
MPARSAAVSTIGERRRAGHARLVSDYAPIDSRAAATGVPPQAIYDDGGFMKDGELRELCHRFFDAIERHDLDQVAAIYAPDFKLWVNVTGTEQTKEQNLGVLADGKSRHRRRTYDDRRISTFATGFIVQYSVNIVQHDGERRSLWACLVAQCKNGQITHIDEYLDSSRFTTASRSAAAT